MQTLNTKLDQILEDQVKSGSFESEEEVTQELLHLLVERDIDKSVHQGMTQIENGQGIAVTDSYKQELQNRIIARLSLNQKDAV